MTETEKLAALLRECPVLEIRAYELTAGDPHLSDAVARWLASRGVRVGDARREPSEAVNLAHRLAENAAALIGILNQPQPAVDALPAPAPEGPWKVSPPAASPKSVWQAFWKVATDGAPVLHVDTETEAIAVRDALNAVASRRLPSEEAPE